MNIFSNNDTKRFFIVITIVMLVILLLSELSVWLLYRELSILLLIILLAATGMILGISFLFFRKQNKTILEAEAQINAYLSGDIDARIDCDSEGELYRLFHSINSLATILNAHAKNENREKEFLKNTMSDISHQLKTPIAALYIYNELLHYESENIPAVNEFVKLSEQELRRIETLVQSLLKITKLDAGSIIIKKENENIAEIIKDIELHFLYQAKNEGKKIVLSGDDNITLLCDRDWIIEAISNIVKNAMDHTQSGNTVKIEWRQYMSIVQITVNDNGSGIHPEDIHHIFKRFFRSHFSKDQQGIGLGLPLAKAIIEEHNGTIEVDSELGAGTTFVINFLIPTEL